MSQDPYKNKLKITLNSHGYNTWIECCSPVGKSQAFWPIHRPRPPPNTNCLAPTMLPTFCLAHVIITKAARRCLTKRYTLHYTILYTVGHNNLLAQMMYGRTVSYVTGGQSWPSWLLVIQFIPKMGLRSDHCAGQSSPQQKCIKIITKNCFSQNVARNLEEQYWALFVFFLTTPTIILPV